MSLVPALSVRYNQPVNNADTRRKTAAGAACSGSGFSVTFLNHYVTNIWTRIRINDEAIGLSFAFSLGYMDEAENIRNMRHFSSESGRATMTILEAALFLDAEKNEIAAPANRPQRRRRSVFHAACIQPLLALAFHKSASKR